MEEEMIGLESTAPVDPLRSEGRNDDEGKTSWALRLVARREHELLALSELSQELTISLDLYGVADLVLFNLMGQLGTSRAALWVVSESPERSMVLLRSHGISKQMALVLGSSCPPDLRDRMARERRLILADELDRVLHPSGAWLVAREGIAILAPILARGQLLGLLALGRRIGGTEFGPVELQVLQTSLGMVGVALQNTALYNRLLENNRQLRVANENLMELDRLKSEFLRNVNHELRTPLTMIIAYLAMLIEQQLHDSKMHEFVGIALRESRKLKAMVENLLEFSAAGRHTLPMDIQVADLRSTLAAYYEERLPGVTEGLREFTYEPEDALPAARFDRARLVQIVDALVDNAVKFTPQGTHIVIRARKTEHESQVSVAIEVADDGPGIPEDRLPILFTSFRQVDGSTTRAVGGLGLGLAFAKQLAEMMGATMSVESEIGRGSIFALVVPAA
jgi:signal transduction histidine kinase